MSAFDSGSYEDATWPVGDPVVIPTELYPSDFTCRPIAGATRIPGSEDYIELGQPQLSAIDRRLLNTPEPVTADCLQLEGWQKFSSLSEKISFTEGLDETVLSRLFVIAEHVQPILTSAMHDNKKLLHRHSWQREMFEDIMLKTDWLKEVIDNPQLSPEICAKMVDFVGNMKPSKKQEINSVRLAATIWYAKMTDSEFTVAMMDAQAMFGRLLTDEIVSAAAKIDYAKRPDHAFDAKRKVIQQLSPYAFAGMPMLPEQVDVVASLCSK